MRCARSRISYRKGLLRESNSCGNSRKCPDSDGFVIDATESREKTWEAGWNVSRYAASLELRAFSLLMRSIDEHLRSAAQRLGKIRRTLDSGFQSSAVSSNANNLCGVFAFLRPRNCRQWSYSPPPAKAGNLKGQPATVRTHVRASSRLAHSCRRRRAMSSRRC